MLTQDETLTIGLRKYREVFPQGTIPAHLEEEMVLSHFPDNRTGTVILSVNFQGVREPFILFQAIVDRETGIASITTRDWRELEGKELDKSQHVN